MIDKNRIYDLAAEVINAMTLTPNGLSLRVTEDERFGVEVAFTVRKSESGKIVGKGGRNIRSLKVIFDAIGAEAETKINVFFDAAPPDQRAEDDLPEAKLWEWDESKVLRLFLDLATLMTGAEPNEQVARMREGQFPSIVSGAALSALLTTQEQIALELIFSAIGHAAGKELRVEF